MGGNGTAVMAAVSYSGDDLYGACTGLYREKRLRQDQNTKKYMGQTGCTGGICKKEYVDPCRRCGSSGRNGYGWNRNAATTAAMAVMAASI